MLQKLLRVLDSSSNITPSASASSPVPSNGKIIVAALKEWAIVCKALEDGRQVLLLRKGGIMEYRQGFEIKHHIFFLYPTFEHQSKKFIQADYASNLEILLRNAPKKGKNRITSYAQAVAVKKVSDKFVLQRLHKYHIWNNQYINSRMNYNAKRPMHVILLRVFKLNYPIELDVKPEWSGCKSWIPIESYIPSPYQQYNQQQDKSNDGSMHDQQYSVLDDLRFNNIVGEIEEILN